MTVYVCMYCQYAFHVECMDRACNCCFGEPGEPPEGLTVICARDYPAAKRFADLRRWPQHSWVYAEERRLHGSEPDRAVYLHGFSDRPDAVEMQALIRQRLERRAQRSLVAARRDAAKLLPELRRQLGGAE